MRHPVYDSPRWPAFRDAILARDGNRCTVGRLLGGRCHPTLDIHHLRPLDEGGPAFDADNAITVCHSHHPQLEALRRALIRPVGWKRCRHHHPYPGGREACERRLNAAA